MQRPRIYSKQLSNEINSSRPWAHELGNGNRKVNLTPKDVHASYDA